MAGKWESTDPELITGDKSFMGELSAEQISAIFREAWDEAENPITDETSAEAFSRQISLIGLRMGLLAHGSDFLIENGAPQKIVDEYEANKWEAVALAAAKRLGLSDHRPLILKATRTKEQEKIMAEIAAREQINRLQVFLGCIYNKATVELMACLMGELRLRNMEELTGREDWDDISSALAFLVRYFFALHGELRAEGVEYIDPVTPCPGELPEKYAEELRRIMRALISYRARHGGGFYSNIAHCFHLEKVPAAQTLEPITEITQKDLFGLPLAKAWRKQREIAQAGREGAELNVGSKTVTGAVIISASISDKDGNPLDIDGWCKSVQRGIGNLIDEAGGKAALPINVTPQQIYRAALRLPSSETVTASQVDQVHEAMKILMYSPATLDYTAQIERHKRIKQQSDIDYDEAQLKRQAPALVMAYRDRFSLRGQIIEDGYKIMAYPLFYEYSHAVNQIAQVPNRYLTGPEKPAIKETDKAEARGTARNSTMREAVYTRVLGMKQRSKAHKSYTPLIRIDEVAADVFPDGLQGLTERGRRTLRKNMSLYLEFLRMDGTIKGFEETKERREVVGYTVKL